MSYKTYHATLPLPNTAVKINGEYLERTIVGYRTSSVSGREPLSVDITDLEIGNMNGSKYRRKKDKTRTITINFALMADSKTEYHDLLTKLKYTISGEEIQWIFRDEEDKYYIGTVESVEVSQFNTAGSQGYGCSGSISVHCCDPYKYSVEEKEITASLDGGYTFGVDYQGTAPCKPKFEFTLNSDNGYFGLLDQNGHILEFGNIEDVDASGITANQTLATLSNLISSPDDTSGKDAMHPLYGVSGTLTTATWYNNTFLKFGTMGTKIGAANGGMRTYTLQVSCVNWYMYCHVLFYAGLMGQTGEMSLSFLTEDDKLIAGYNWYKTDTSGNTGAFDFVVYNPNKKDTDAMAGKVMKTFKYTTSHIQSQNPWFWNWGHCDLRKEGSKITFYYYGSYYSYTVPDIEKLACKKVQFSVKQWGDRAGSKFMQYAGLNNFRIQRLNVASWENSKNLFVSGDKVEIDVDNMSVTLNGMDKVSIGKIANDWENFTLKPGSNQIKVTSSSWIEKVPTLKIKYREVYL